jgi:hypothetical protein
MAKGGAAGGGGGGETNLIFFISVGTVAAFMGFAAFYAGNKGGINNLIYLWTKIQIAPFLAFSHPVGQVWDFMNRTDPHELSADQSLMLISFGGQYGRWWITPFILAMTFFGYRKVGKVERFNRLFTMQKLLKHNAQFFAALNPVVNRPRLIIDEPTSQGAWRVLESPMLFALRQGIIKDNKGNIIKESQCYTENGLPRERVKPPAGGFIFDLDKANHVYIQRLGPAHPASGEINGDALIKGLKTLPRYLRGFIGALSATAIGHKDKGSAILDAMSLSFDEEKAVKSQNELGIAGDFDLDIKDADHWIERTFKARPDSQSDVESDLAASLQASVVNHSSYLYPWLAQLLTTSRLQGGSTPPNEFIWMRPACRPLWYFLNAVGGNTVSAEGAAPWAHWNAEKVLGDRITEPVVDSASMALRQAIDDEGWLDMGKKKDKDKR